MDSPARSAPTASDEGGDGRRPVPDSEGDGRRSVPDSEGVGRRSVPASANVVLPSRAAAPPDAPDGVLRFPESDGRRSTAATTRAIVADAARAADPLLATRIAACESWRGGYAPFLRTLTTLAAAPGDALAIARAGLDSMRRRLVLETGDGEVPLSDALRAATTAPRFGSGEVHGTGALPERLEVPYRGRTLHGAALREQLELWVDTGIVEESFATAVGLVAEHPEWLALPGRTVAVIGAGSEIGPFGPLCAWGADLLAIDVPDSAVWSRVLESARNGSGRVRMPVAEDGSPGVDIVAGLPAVHDWLARSLAGSEGSPVLGMYAYADGGAHVLLSGAFDALATRLADEHPSTALAYLATPTDAYVVPTATAERARAAYDARRGRKLAQAPLKVLSGGRLYRPAYAEPVPVADALIEQQGPNYAIAKRLQRWRGVCAAHDGRRMSFNVAPATWTRSVTKNRVLAAAYAGAGLFGIEIFEAATTRVLMAALLVHDLNAEPATGQEPEQLFSDGAAHGGLWTAAYEARSALVLAALAGLPASLVKGRRRR